MLQNNDWRDYANQFLSTSTKGLSKARNELASRAEGQILLFADDDVTLTQEGWNMVTRIKPHEICMTEGTNHPISRVMSVHADTFWDIGGFDESIIYNGEDLDFYIRANENFNVKILPKEYTMHQDHTIRQPYRCQFDAAYVRVKHNIVTPEFFVQKNPVNSVLRFLGYINSKITLQKTPDIDRKTSEDSDPEINHRQVPEAMLEIEN